MTTSLMNFDVAKNHETEMIDVTVYSNLEVKFSIPNKSTDKEEAKHRLFRRVLMVSTLSVSCAAFGMIAASTIAPVLIPYFAFTGGAVGSCLGYLVAGKPLDTNHMYAGPYMWY